MQICKAPQDAELQVASDRTVSEDEPGDQQRVRVGELPDQSATPVSHRLSRAEARVRRQARAKLVGLADVHDVGVWDPFGKQPYDRDCGVFALEVAGRTRVEKLRVVGGLPVDDVAAGFARNLR